MKVATDTLIDQLLEMVRRHLVAAEQFSSEETEVLKQHPAPGSWNVLECIEHLNRYGNFYLPEITRGMADRRHPRAAVFHSGWLGDYFARMMLPGERTMKMKTFNPMNPSGDTPGREVLGTFIGQQRALLDLLQQAREINLTKTKTAISISKWIRLRLGDTFRVVIYHNERHIVQAQRALNAAKQGISIQ